MGWAMHVRALRNEEGYQILTHHDRSDLNSDEYLLETDKPLPSFDADIPKNIQDNILNSNDFACYMCGCVAGERDIYDATKTVRLHIGHIIDKSMGGTDEPGNLRAICSVCNEGASNLTLNRPDAVKLIAQVRRAPAKDQLDVLKWLVQKFPVQAKDLLP